MALFSARFQPAQSTTVLDMGGDVFNWTMVAQRPQVTILNIYDQNNKADWARYVVGDGCRTGFPSQGFDIVFSNSVIEHVGGIDRQREFASECMRCGHAFFVQTPNKWFPFDTHTLSLFIHWLPQKVFRKLVRFTPRFLFFKPDPGDLADFSNMHLLTRREMRELFPGAEIIEEKFLGMTKSLIAASPLPYSGSDQKKEAGRREAASDAGV